MTSREMLAHAECQANDSVHAQRKIIAVSVLLFVVSFIFLFMGMHRYPEPYDEGLVLTGAMRVAAGQVPHRDFYAIYGPADFYIPAALFKVLGQSVLIVRLLNLFVESLTVAATFAIASQYCRRPVAIASAGVTIVWIYGLNIYICSTVFPVALLNLISSVLLIPLFANSVTRKRLCLAGAIAGLSALYRYDTGAALFVLQVFLIAITCYVQPRATSKRMSVIASTLWPYVVGFAIPTLPAAVYFLSVSPAYPLIYDVFILQVRNYSRGRNLPFPGIHFKTLDELAVYIPIITVTASFFALLSRSFRSHRNPMRSIEEHSTNVERIGLIVTLSLLALVMLSKAYVRLGPLPIFPSLLPSILLMALLFEHRAELPRVGRILVNCLVGFCFFTAMFSAAKATRHLILEGSVPGRIVRVLLASNKLVSENEADWCALSNPLTKGFCFSGDEGRLKAIEFIDSHTRPDQRLFVGLSRHDKVYENDNLIYFGSQRLPATMWSHFDPGLQNSYPIQWEMVEELKRSAPPYIILDSEFDSAHEPNDSSKSTGVTLLDDFIHSKYRFVQSFEEMSIWELISQTQ